MTRVLYIQATMVPPPVDQTKDRFLLLSEYMEGDVLQPVWYGPAEIESTFGPSSYPVYNVGKFRYHWFPTYEGKVEKSRLATFWFYLTTGYRVCRERRIDCIVVYGHLTTGLCGVVLKLLTGVKLIVEVMIAPDRMYLVDRPKVTLVDRLRHFYSTVCLHITMWSSDLAHVLYEKNLAPYPLLRNTRTSVFHDFTSLPEVAKHDATGSGKDVCILLAGSPWYRKGVDVAIAAFRRLSADFPHAKLQIVGHFPDGVPQKLAGDCSRIEILKAVPHEQMMGLVSSASIMLLPSRNEGLPRILLEGMAAGLPLVATDVAGIPTVIRHEENGLLFPVDDVAALEACLRKLLSDSSLRERMGRRSLELLHTGFTEQAYVENFVKMVSAVVPVAAGTGGSAA